MRLIAIINFNRLTALTKIKTCLNFCPKARLKTLIMAVSKLNELKIYAMSQKPGKLTMNSQKRCIQGHRKVTATTVLRWQTRFSATKEVKRHIVQHSFPHDCVRHVYLLHDSAHVFFIRHAGQLQVDGNIFANVGDSRHGL